MTPKLKKRWLAVGIIWGTVMALTGWNIHLIDRIQSRRQDMETLQMDMRFLNDHRAAIQEVRLQRSRLTHRVASTGLGFVVVESNLKRLSWEFGLGQLRVEADLQSSSPGRMPLSVFATGPIPGVVGWINAVEEAYPYLVIERMEMAHDPATGGCQLQATFTYHFMLSEAERVG